MQPRILLCVLLILYTNIKSGFTGCSEKCSGISNRFNFKKGSSYIYNYQSSTKVQLVGNSDKAGTVGIQAKATISVLDQCEYLLQLSDVKFNGPPAALVGFDLAQELAKHPLLFAYDNGAVPRICPSAQENNDALNIKRGILSTFQLSNDFDVEDAYESDVTGNCPVKSSSKQEGDTKVVTEKKNLLACRNHVHNYTSFRMIPYDVISQVQNVPAMDATQTCVYRVQKNILNEANCEESHNFLPYRSSTGGGISSRIESKLTFAQIGKAATAAAAGKPESLLFNEQPFIYRESKEAAGKARNLIKLLQDTAAKEARPESPGHFQELVHTLKALTLEDLKALAQDAKAATALNPKAKRIYVDAVGQCGTPNCVQLLVQLLNPKQNSNVPELTPMERRFILVNLALTPHPTEQGVAAVTTGLEQLPGQGLFAATSLVNNYIRRHANGQNSNEVKKFMQTYLGILSKLSPSAKPAENDRLIEVLRALGNLANVQEGINERLSYLDKVAPIDVKLAAIQSLRRAPCVPATENKLYSIYADEKTSVEIRLNAFLVLVRQCSKRELIDKLIQHASTQNKLNQIGAFVQTYFKSNRDSKDPSKDKSSLARAFLKKKYPTDSDRYSTYKHFSSFNHAKNLGYHADLASIYVPEDAYPRQQFANLTLDLWGSEVNILELGYRNEKLHDVADNLFGPEGYFTESVLAGDREVRKKENKHPKLAEYQTQFDAKHKIAQGLDISAYIRLFGDELAYAGAYDVNVIKQFKGLIDYQAVMNAVDKDQTGSFYVHRLPVDSFFTIPVISGFPLRLASNGSIVINVDASVKAAVKNVPDGNAEIRLKLKPSAAYQASCHMAVYTGSVKNGVRYSRNSHSATDMEFELKLSKNEILSAKLNLPKPRQEVYSVETHVYTIINDVPIEEKGAVANRGQGKMCAPSLFNQYTGFKICTSIAYPNASNIKESPYFPLTGPMKAEFFIDKDDPDLKSYELTASWPANPKGRTVNIKFDTPKSKINRQRSLVVNYERQKSIDLTFTSPTNKVTSKGVLEGAGPDQTGAKVTTNINGKIYEFVGKVKTETNKATHYRKYNFDGAVTTAEIPKAGALKGFLEMQPGSKVNLNADLTELYDKPISLKARYEKAAHKHSIEYDYRGLEGPRRLAGDLNIKSMSDMEYKFESEYVPKTSQKPNKVTYEHKHSGSFAGRDSKLTANSKITSSLYPTINCGYDLLYQQQSEKIEIKASTTESGTPGVNLEVVAKTRPNDYDVTALLKYKASVNQKVTAVYRQDPVKGYEASLTYKDPLKNREAKASLTVKGQRVQGPVAFTGDATAVVSIPGGTEYKIVGSIKQGATPDDYVSVITANLPQNRKAEIKSTWKGKYGDFTSQQTIILPDTEPFEISEKIKCLDHDYLYNIDVKKKGASVMLFDVALNRKDLSKTPVKWRAQAPQQQIDYAFDGLYHKKEPSYHISGTMNKNNKPYFKSDVAVPRSWSPDVNRQARFYITYDLDQTPQKSVKLDYKTEKSGPAVDYNAVVDIDLPNADYKFDFKRRSSEAKANNLTIFRQDKPIIQVNVGRLQRQGQSGYFDVNVKTFTPYQPRDLAGRLSFETSSQVYKGDLFLADQQQNQKLGVQFEANKIPNGFDKKLNVKVNEMELEVKNKYAAQADNKGVDVSGAASFKNQGAPQAYKWTYNHGPNKVQAQIETPIAQMNKASILAEHSQQGAKKTMKYEVVVGKETTSLDSVYDYSPQNLLLDLNIKSTLAALKNIQYSVKSDQRKGLDAGFNLNVNDMHKLASFYKRASEKNGDEKYGIGFTAKLGTAYDWETSSDSSWNDKNGKYSTKNTIKTSPAPTNKYRVDVELDTKNMHTKVDLENIPGIKTPVKGQAKKVGDNEYEISLEDASGPNKGKVGFKFTSAQQKIRLETAAFKSSIESEYTATKFGVGCSVTPDPAVPNKVFGLKYATEAANEFDRSANLQVTYPERTIAISSKRIRQLNAKLDQTIEWSPNHGKRQPVKVQYSVVRTPDSKTKCEVHLNDPTLPEGVHLLADYTQTGKVAQENSPYSLNAEITLKYSNDPQRHLTIKKENKRDMVGQRSKVHTQVQVQHGASNLNHKIYNTYMLEPCESTPDCEYIFAMGASYPTPAKKVEEFGIDLKRSEKKFETTFIAGADKYKLSRQQSANARSYLWSKNDKELYNINAEVTRKPQPSVTVSILEKARNIVLVQATAGLKANDLATVQIQHDQDGKKIQDIEATIRLETSNRLKIKYLRRPGLVEFINNYIKTLPSPASVINWPVVQSHSSIGKEIADKMKPFFDSLDKEDTAIATELKFTSGKFSNVLKEQSENIGEAMNFAIDSMTSYSNAAATTFMNITQSYRSAAREFAGRLPDFNKNVVVPLVKSWATVGERSNDLYKRGSKAFDEVYTGSKVNDVVNQATTMYREAGPGSPYQKFVAIYKKLTKSDGPAGPGVMGTLSQIRKQRGQDLVAMWASIRPSLVSDENYKEMTEFFDQVSDKLQWAMKYKYTPEGEQKAPGPWFSYPDVPYEKFSYNVTTDPQSKAVTASLVVPLMRDYTSLQDLAEALSPERIGASITELQETAETYLDKIFGVDSGLPAGESRAIIVGQQHFVTFDGQVRTVSTDCSYLLAKDFIDSLFSVQIQFNKQQGNEIIVEFKNKDRIAFTVDGKVTINGKNAELPFQVLDDGSRHKITVVRDDEYFVRAETFNGLTVECNSYAKLCIVTLTDRFRGRTNGLLGRNDGETYTDLSLPDDSIATDLNSYLKAWALTPACAGSANSPVTGNLSTSHPSYKDCERLFAGRSKCPRVDQPSFHSLCLNSAKQFIEKKSGNQNQSICLSSAAFLSVCPGAGEPPAQCIECEIPKGRLLSGESKELTGDKQLSNRVDVVFVVENQDCINNVKGKLGSLAQSIESKLKSSQNDVKFGLVAFNGLGDFKDPAFFTNGGQVSFSAAGLQAAANRLEFPVHTMLDKQKALDVVEQLVEDFPFRSNSRKVLVLFSCYGCQTLELNYYSLQEKLLGNNIALHVVSSSDISLGSPSTDIIGFDAKALIKAGGVRNVQDRPNLSQPYDSCTVLAQETNGTVFSIATQTAVGPVFDALAKEVSRTAQGNDCNVCECTSCENTPVTNCYPCQIPSPAYITSDKTGFLNNPLSTLTKLGT